MRTHSAITAASNPFYFAATRLHLPTGTAAAPSGLESQCSSIIFATPDYPIKNLRIFYPAFSAQFDGEHNAPNAYMLNGISLGVGGVWTSGKLAGQSSYTVDPAVDNVGILSDAYSGTIAANTVCTARQVFTVSVGQSFLAGMELQTQNGEGQDGAAAASTLLTKLTDGSAMTNNGGLNYKSAFGPAFAIAQGTDGRPVFCIIGDSIAAYVHDSQYVAGSRGVLGYIGRGLDDNVSSRRMAYGTLASQNGGAPSNWGTTANWPRMFAAMTQKCPNIPFTNVISEMGINNVTNQDLPYLSNTFVYMTTMFSCLKSAFGKPITQCEILPEPLSSDAWQTFAGQTFAGEETQYFSGSRSSVIASHPNAQLWLTNLDIGNGVNDPTSYFQANGYITDSIAPWTKISYDTGSNRARWAIMTPFTTTLTSNFTTPSSIPKDFLYTMVVDIAPRVGETLNISKSGGSFAYGTVVSVSGSGPYTISFYGPGSKPPSQSIGTVLYATLAFNSSSAIHPGSIGHQLCAQSIVDYKNSRFG
jgi:hypothetical protein